MWGRAWSTFKGEKEPKVPKRGLGRGYLPERRIDEPPAMLELGDTSSEEELDAQEMPLGNTFPHSFASTSGSAAAAPIMLDSSDDEYLNQPPPITPPTAQERAAQIEAYNAPEPPPAAAPSPAQAQPWRDPARVRQELRQIKAEQRDSHFGEYGFSDSEDSSDSSSSSIDLGEVDENGLLPDLPPTVAPTKPPVTPPPAPASSSPWNLAFENQGVRSRVTAPPPPPAPNPLYPELNGLQEEQMENYGAEDTVPQPRQPNWFQRRVQQARDWHPFTRSPEAVYPPSGGRPLNRSLVGDDEPEVRQRIDARPPATVGQRFAAWRDARRAPAPVPAEFAGGNAGGFRRVGDEGAIELGGPGRMERFVDGARAVGRGIAGAAGVAATTARIGGQVAGIVGRHALGAASDAIQTGASRVSDAVGRGAERLGGAIDRFETHTPSGRPPTRWGSLYPFGNGRGYGGYAVPRRSLIEKYIGKPRTTTPSTLNQPLELEDIEDTSGAATPAADPRDNPAHFWEGTFSQGNPTPRWMQTVRDWGRSARDWWNQRGANPAPAQAAQPAVEPAVEPEVAPQVGPTNAEAAEGYWPMLMMMANQQHPQPGGGPIASRGPSVYDNTVQAQGGVQQPISSNANVQMPNMQPPEFQSGISQLGDVSGQQPIESLPDINAFSYNRKQNKGMFG